eukprot:tig00000430_g622.t1
MFCNACRYGPEGPPPAASSSSAAPGELETRPRGLAFPQRGYVGESFYRKLFGRGLREPFGKNDPTRREDVAGAVARTVAFVAEETGATEVPFLLHDTLEP